MSIRTQKSCGLFLCGPLICKDCPSTMSWTWTTRWASLVILKHFETTLFIFIIYLSFFIYCGSCKCRLCPTSCPSRDWQTIASLCDYPDISPSIFWKAGHVTLELGILVASPRIGQSSEFPQAWSMKQYYIIILIWYTVKIFADLGSILKYSFFVCSWSWYMIYVYYIIYLYINNILSVTASNRQLDRRSCG